MWTSCLVCSNPKSESETHPQTIAAYILWERQVWREARLLRARGTYAESETKQSCTYYESVRFGEAQLLRASGTYTQSVRFGEAHLLRARGTCTESVPLDSSQAQLCHHSHQAPDHAAVRRCGGLGPVWGSSARVCTPPCQSPAPALEGGIQSRARLAGMCASLSWWTHCPDYVCVCVWTPLQILLPCSNPAARTNRLARRWRKDFSQSCYPACPVTTTSSSSSSKSSHRRKYRRKWDSNWCSILSKPKHRCRSSCRPRQKARVDSPPEYSNEICINTTWKQRASLCTCVCVCVFVCVCVCVCVCVPTAFACSVCYVVRASFTWQGGIH